MHNAAELITVPLQVDAPVIWNLGPAVRVSET